MSSPSSRTRRSAAAAVAAAALAVQALVLVAGTATAPPAAAYPAAEVEFRGRGFGHGRGLGQYGALGYAIDEGASYGSILDHYYGGTTAGTRADEIVTVRLTEHDGRPTTVTSGAAFEIGDNKFLPNEVARIRWTGLDWLIEQGSSCTGDTWSPRQTVSGANEPIARVQADPGDDISRMIVVCGANRRHYRGEIQAKVVDGTPRTINRVFMEQYLRGVVPRESPASWADLGGGRGIQALRAQAVAARSYAYAENRAGNAFKTCDTTACQVYGGAGLNGRSVEDARTDRAVRDTAGQIRVRNGTAARTEFSSSTGGWTAGGTFPAVPDNGDDVAVNPYRSWTTMVPVARVEQAYPTVGPLQSIVVADRNGLGPEGGRVLRVRVTGSLGSVVVTGDALRSALDLRSDWFRVIDPTLNSPAVAAAPVAGGGFVVTSGTGEVLTFGAATDAGSMEGVPLNRPVVGVATTPSGKGYWLVASDGGIFNFGDAAFHGSTGAIRLNQPIVGMAASRTGNGYWLVASDGGVFAFGDARFLGSMGAVRLNQPVVGMAAAPQGEGYWMVARDGGIFSFGSAGFKGSTGNIRLNQPIVGMTADPRNRGYWFVAADGGVFAFPNELFRGSSGGSAVSAPIVAMATTPTGEGYWLVGRDGNVYDHGDASL